MEMLPFGSDLRGKVAVITGAGGVICSCIAKACANAGAKVALLDLSEEKAEAFAKEIVAAGGVAKGYGANVLDKRQLEDCRERVLADLGKCDILINGAGGNNPRAQTDKEYYENGDEAATGLNTWERCCPRRCLQGIWRKRAAAV